MLAVFDIGGTRMRGAASAQAGQIAVLGEVPNVAEIELTSRVPNREFQATITYDLSGIEPGSYVLITTLRDKNSAKSGSFETPIEIAP